MEAYTLIGHPLGHSMSPFIHKKLFELSGKNSGYDCTDIQPNKLSETVPELKSINGFNVTIPYKVEMIKYTDELDETAKRYNSVNCVALKDGKAVGFNTDCDGFLRSLGEFPKGNVLLLGCGGVGRMMAIETVLHGCPLTIAYIPEAEETVSGLVSEILEICPNAHISKTFISEIHGHFDLLVNATPVGMYPKIDACPVSEDVIADCDAVFDAVYNPSETKLIRTASKLGKKTVGGMAMLVLQAVKAHEIWDGDFYTPEQINSIIKEAQRKVDTDFK